MKAHCRAMGVELFWEILAMASAYWLREEKAVLQPPIVMWACFGILLQIWSSVWGKQHHGTSSSCSILFMATGIFLDPKWNPKLASFLHISLKFYFMSSFSSDSCSMLIYPPIAWQLPSYQVRGLKRGSGGRQRNLPSELKPCFISKGRYNLRPPYALGIYFPTETALILSSLKITGPRNKMKPVQIKSKSLKQRWVTNPKTLWFFWRKNSAGFSHSASTLGPSESVY